MGIRKMLKSHNYYESFKKIENEHEYELAKILLKEIKDKYETLVSEGKAAKMKCRTLLNEKN